MKIPLHIAQKILQLSNGEILPSSAVKHPLTEELISERIIERTGRIQKKIKLINRNALCLYLHNKYGISDLQRYIDVAQQDEVTRSDLVAVSSNSKMKNIRTFKGFLITSYHPLKVMLNGAESTLNFTQGTFQFIYDFENFIPDENSTIVGIENAENFRWIARQKYLFEDLYPLFVSRYPQSQSKDLVKWLQSVPNSYLHFGDFDFSGIGIYLHEFKKHLSEKATFFVPDDIDKLISEFGNNDRYNQQRINFNPEHITEQKLRNLIRLLHLYKKGLDQEILIKLKE